VLFNHLA